MSVTKKLNLYLTIYSWFNFFTAR